MKSIFTCTYLCAVLFLIMVFLYCSFLLEHHYSHFRIWIFDSLRTFLCLPVPNLSFSSYVNTLLKSKSLSSMFYFCLDCQYPASVSSRGNLHVSYTCLFFENEYCLMTISVFYGIGYSVL